MTLVSYGPEGVRRSSGAPAIGTTVSVVLRGTSTLIPLFEDVVGAVAIPNPLNVDIYGNIFFCAAPGEYDLLIDSGRIPFVLDQPADIEVFPMGRPGLLAASPGNARLPIDGSYILEGYRVVVGTPSDGPIVLDFNKNGTTIFTTQANRPTIAAGANLGSTTTPDVVAFADGDYITVDVDSVGSPAAPGTDLTVTMRMRRVY